jgi:hypothetical protein
MILVIRHALERAERDKRGNVVAEAGEVYVSHGVDLNTGKGIPLPWEKWSTFAHNCFNYEGEWYLK